MSRPLGDRRPPFEFPNTVFTLAKQATIIEAVHQMVPMAYAAQRAGVSAGTVASWIERGRSGTLGPDEQHFADFAEAIAIAQAEAIYRMHIKALAGGPGSAWAAWMLERLKREEYGPVHKIEHTDLPVDDLSTMSDERLIAERAERLRKLREVGAGDMETYLPEEPKRVGSGSAEPLPAESGTGP